jgi:hypothetical protein
MSSSSCNNTKKFFHYCNLNGHWEEKFCKLHSKLHPINCTAERRVWKVKIEEYEESLAYYFQGVVDSQGSIKIGEFNDTNMMDNRSMPRVATI